MTKNNERSTSSLSAANDNQANATPVLSPPLPVAATHVCMQMPYVGHPFAPPFMLPSYRSAKRKLGG